MHGFVPGDLSWRAGGVKRAVRAFGRRPQVPQQRYCTAPACQRERRRRWQQSKRQCDADYRDNQARAQRAWRQRHRHYWREYRRTHPQYCERNRTQQHRRNALSRAGPIAKMDASRSKFPLPSGTYRLELAAPGAIAKMDACTVEKSPCFQTSTPRVDLIAK